MKYAYFVVEGAHDVSAVGKILCLHGAKEINNMKKLDTYWKRVIPTTYPHNGELNRRMPVPVFFQSADFSVAIQIADGDSQLVKRLTTSLTNVNEAELAAIALFTDADEQSAVTKCQQILGEIEKSPIHIVKSSFQVTQTYLHP